MADFSAVYGPLDKSSCVYFFAWTMFFFILLVIAFFAELYVLLTDFKRLTRGNIIGGIVMFFNIFLAYFVNRLLYTMCNKSLA